MNNRDKQQSQLLLIVQNALCDLTDGMARAVVKNDYFITRVVARENNKETHMATIIDLEMKMTWDYDEFMAHSQYLYKKYAMVKTWYEC